MLRNSEATELFTPSEEEQVWFVLQGQCPHNQGWSHAGHSHNDDAYECNICGKTVWW